MISKKTNLVNVGHLIGKWYKTLLKMCQIWGFLGAGRRLQCQWKIVKWAYGSLGCYVFISKREAFQEILLFEPPPCPPSLSGLCQGVRQQGDTRG